MKKIILVYGLLAALILNVFMFTLTPVWEKSGDFQKGEYFGYASIILACTMILAGVYKYRQSTGGILTFGKGFVIGLSISVIASLLYVAGWMIYSNYVDAQFVDAYFAYSVDQLKSQGLPKEELEMKLQEMEQFKKIYQQPLIQMGFTFLEVFPIGVLFSLIAGLVFRRK